MGVGGPAVDTFQPLSNSPLHKGGECRHRFICYSPVVKLAVLLFLATSMVYAQTDETSRSWNQPREPFRIIGNVYYVGASEIASYLITSSSGHILLDGGFAETSPMIIANIRTLGFQPADVKILLNSQSHFDHAGGLAELKRQTGAKMIASEEDGAVLSRGGRDDFYFGDKMVFEPVHVDRTIVDREPVSVGNVTMTPVLTPGHTKGCTTWTTTLNENGRDLHVVFLCGLTILPNTRLVEKETYPGIASDFTKSYELLKKLPCDVFLGAHGSYFHLDEKWNRMKEAGMPNPFIGDDELRKYVEEKEHEFHTILDQQK